jgi:hypothetical protein
MNEANEQPKNTLARAVAPEDISEGDYLAVLNEIDEYVPMEITLEPWRGGRMIEPIRILTLPCGECMPMKVEAVCLPFVLIKRIDGGVRTLDARRYRLARLRVDYGKRVWKLLKDKRRPTSALGPGCK